MFAGETVFIQVREPLLIKGQRVNRPVGGDYRPPVPPRRRGWGGGGGSEVRVVNRDSRNTHTHGGTANEHREASLESSGCSRTRDSGSFRGMKSRRSGQRKCGGFFIFLFVFSMGQVIKQESVHVCDSKAVSNFHFDSFHSISGPRI